MLISFWSFAGRVAKSAREHFIPHHALSGMSLECQDRSCYFWIVIFCTVSGITFSSSGFCNIPKINFRHLPYTIGKNNNYKLARCLSVNMLLSGADQSNVVD